MRRSYQRRGGTMWAGIVAGGMGACGGVRAAFGVVGEVMIEWRGEV